VLSDVLSNNLTMLRVGMRENVLDEIVAVLVTGDVNQWDARTIKATFTDAVKVAAEEVNTTNLKALLNNLRGKLIHAVLRGIADDMVSGSAAISWGTWTILESVLDECIWMRQNEWVNERARLLNLHGFARYSKGKALNVQQPTRHFYGKIIEC
jgi:hypothetical protein